MILIQDTRSVQTRYSADASNMSEKYSMGGIKKFTCQNGELF